MAASEFIGYVWQRLKRAVRALFLVLLACAASTAHAQWTALGAPGQSTRSVAKEPTVLAIAKSARILAVGLKQSKAVAFYHPDTAASLGSTNLPKEPVAIVLSDDGSKAYALYESSGIKIAVINTSTLAITSTWSTSGDPVGMVLNGNELLVADKNGDRLVGIGTTNGIVTRTKSLSKEPLMIGLGAASALILVGTKEGEMQLLNSSTLAVTRTVKVADDIRSLAWWDGGSTGSGRVLAVGKSQNALNLVDPATGNIARVALGGDPNTVGVENHNNWAYVGEKDDQIVCLIDLIDKALSGFFAIPGKIGSLLFDQQGVQLFVTLTKDDKLLRLDPNQASLISKIGVTKSLKDVAVNSATSDAITISYKDADFARVNLATYTVQTLVLPVKADKVVVDSSINVAIIGATNDKLSFVNLATQPASLYPQQVDLDGDIKDMAVDPTRSITVAVVRDKQHVRVISNVTRTEIAAVPTSDKYVAVAIHSGKGIAYLATDNKKLALFSLISRTVTQTINLNFDVEGIAVDPTLNRAVLTSKDQGNAWILNLDSLQMVTSIAMAKNPGAVAIQTDTHIAVVASKDDDSLSLIDLTSNTATLNFSQIDKPTGLAISNRFNKVLVVSSEKNDLAIVQLPNVAATVSDIDPSQVAAGAGGTTLTINGARFVDGAVVYFGSTPLATTWVSSTRLTASIPASLLATIGTNGIRVQNPPPAGGTSASLTFTVGTSGLSGAPAIGVAVAANAQALISFTAPASNGGSAITSYTAASTPGNITGTCGVPCANINVIGLSNGTAYSFTVTATNSAGTGAASAPSNSVTPATVPDAPVIGVALANNASASIIFTAPVSDGGSAITSYTATSSPGNIAVSCTAPCVTITVVGLANGTAYTFTVKASSAIGTGAASASSNSVTPTGGVPGAPTIGTATSANAQATVNFTAPASTGGSTITGYTVTSIQGAITATGPASPIVVTGLTNGTAYTFTVKAANANGSSAASAASNSVTPATVPGAPIIGVATAGNAQVTATFTAPTSNGGNPITGYTASCGAQSNAGLTSPIVVSGLVNGLAATCIVTATNAFGTGAASGASNTVTPANVPGAPSVGIAVAGNGQATVPFTAPASNGGSAITSYAATSSPGNITATCVAPCNSIIVAGLANGTPVTFTVRATNGFGAGMASTISNSVTPATIPGAPVIGIASAGNAAVMISFSAPESNGGSIITGYTASCGAQSNSGVGSPITVTGLANGTPVTCRVSASNAIGPGPASAASNSVLPAAGIPGAPTIGTASAANASANVTFTPPLNDGGSAITSYTASSTPGNITGTCNAPCNTVTVNGLVNGSAVTFTVRATNAAGLGAASFASNSITPSGLPGAPTIGNATAGNGNAIVSFSLPASNGGSAILGYTVTTSPGGVTATGAASPITVSSLTNGIAVTFTVKATNANGSGSASATSNSVTPASVPGAPVIGTATAGNAQVTIGFTAPVGNGGTAITGYTATCGGLSSSGTASPITVTGLTNGIAVTCTVSASNVAGTSASSAVSNSVTPNVPATVPAAPMIGIATAANASATITFAPAASNGSSAVTSYIATAAPGGLTGFCTAPCSAINVAGLTNGTVYTFTVKSINATGTSPASVASNSVTPSVPATVPSAPTIGTATPGNASATVTFTAPANNGGSATTSYIATSAPSGLTGNCAAPCGAINVAGLFNGTTYTFTVTAINAIGAGPASVASNSVTPNLPATVPGVPTIGSATAGLGQATVTFAAPASSGGAAITTYTAVSTPGAVTGTCTAPCIAIIVNGLANGTTYTFRVSATNAVGTGSPSSASNSVMPTQLSQTITAFSPATPISYSADATFVLSATGGASGNPVVFATTTPATCSVSGNTVSILSVGTCTLTANQAGDSGYGAAAQISRNVVISKGSQLISFGTLPDVSVLSGPISLSATASSGLPVSYTSGTTTACTISGTTVALVIAGTCTVHSNQAGNVNFNAAAQVSQSFAITFGPATQTITGFAPATPVSFVAGGTFSITAFGGASGNPVVFGSASSNICSVTGDIVTMVTTGSCALTADQAGNASYGPALQQVANVVIEPSSGSPTPARLITPTLPSAILGQPYNASFVVSSSPNVSSVTVTGLPTGVTASDNGRGTIKLSGTPSAAGEFVLTGSATSAFGTAIVATTLSVTAYVTTIQSISAGKQHSCVAFNGGVRCWGYNFLGQLGNGTTTTSSAAVVAVAENSGATSVTAGLLHSCAVVNGGVQCWGNNSNGQLGDNTLVQRLAPIVTFPAGSNIALVSAGGWHSCAVVNGGARCWGLNNSGQLGNGSTTSSQVPVIAIADGSGVTAVAAGKTHTCALISGGVQCWGSNSNNELANFTFTASAVPISVIAANSGVTAISAGSTSTFAGHTCVVIGDSVQCWGSNNRGKLGGFSTNSQIRYAIYPGSGATAVAAGGEHTCAIVAGGVKCWGQNNIGQLGAGFSTNGNCCQGNVFDAIPAGSNVTAISAGAEHTCAIANNFVQCWGNRLSGRLGNIIQNTYTTPITSIATGSKVASINIGDPRTCAVINDGLQCWGTNGALVDKSFAITSEFPVAQKVSAAAAGRNHLCAIVDGAIRCRGDNTYGQSGNGTTVYGDQPVSLAAGSRVSGVAAGWFHSCALVNGGVQCWGGNDDGQLGNNTTNRSLIPVMTTAADAGATAISTTGFHTCAVINGGVQCWGSNDLGQLGNNGVTRSLVPVTAIAPASGATAVSAGYRHTCAVISGGVQCWGDNATGQLGIGNTITRLLPTQVIAAGSNVTAIAAGYSHTCAVVNGGVQCWGTNNSGELGNNTTTSSTLPVTAIPVGSNVIAVAVGTPISSNLGHSCAVLNGGAVCWGNNTLGELGKPFVAPNDKVLAAITSALVPSAPTITGTSVTATSITLAFTPPASNGGSAIAGFVALCTSQPARFAPGDATSITVTGLNTGATYTCTISATNIIGTGPASNSISATPVAPVVQPSITITTPANNASLAQGAINIGVTAQAGSSTLRKIELFDGASLINTFNTPSVDSYTYTYGWSGMALGSHTLTAKVTNWQSNSKVSAPVTIQVLSPPTVTLNTQNSFILAGSNIDLIATATSTGSASISKVELFANNGSTNTLIGTVTTAPYGFRWLNVAAGNYSITAKATDSLGLSATSAGTNITVSTNVTIQFATGLNGSTVDDDTLLISGTVGTTSNSAVNINGRLATVTSGGQFFLNDLNLQAGPNTVTATVTSADGQTATQTITINRSANAPLFEVTVGQGGIVIPGSPADVDVTIASAANTPFATINIDCISPSGGSDVMQLKTYQCRYANPGTFEVRVGVKNGAGLTIYSVTKRVMVRSAEQHVLNVKAVYSTVIDRLLAGDKEAALKLFFSHAQVKYAQIFTDLGANLATAVAQFGSVSLVSAGQRTGEIVVVRNVAGEQRVFMVYLMQGEDGIWRIESM